MTGNIIVENITVSARRKNLDFRCGDNSRTHILVHNKEHAFDINPMFDYDIEVPMLSDGVTDQSIYKKDDGPYASGYVFDYEKIFEYLSKEKVFLAENLETVEVDTDEVFKVAFERSMKDWGQYYGHFAGCETLSISEDDEVKGNHIYPGGGDWIVHDVRGQSGTYGYSHDDASIVKVRIKKPGKHGVNYKLKKLKLKVDAETLMTRYQWVAMLFINWTHIKSVSPFGNWEDEAAMTKSYEDERTVFVEDPHLALYWLIHFGFTLDKRYEEVKKIIIDNNLTEKLDLIREPLGFFAKTDAFYDVKLSDSYSKKEEFVELFLKRRSYLVWVAHSYHFRGGANAVDLWWLSIKIYPKVETFLIRRMRWLGKNLKKYNQWDAFDKLIKSEKSELNNIPLLSYILAENPNTKDRGKYADLFLKELLADQETWKGNVERSFAQVMIFDIKEHFKNKYLLKEVVDFYFKDDTTSKEYEGIMSILGVKTEQLSSVRDTLLQLKKAYAGYDRFETPDKDKAVYHQKVKSIFDGLEPKILFEVAENIKDYELAKRTFRYLFLSNYEGKKKSITALFIRLAFSPYDIPPLFKDEFPHLIKGEQDPNIEIIMSWLWLKPNKFSYESTAKKAREGAVTFLLDSLHLPKVFDLVHSLVLDKKAHKIPNLISSIFTCLYSEQYDTKLNPAHQFSKEQVVRTLEVTWDYIKKYQIEGEFQDAIRVLYYFDSPLGEDWIRQRYNSPKVKKDFPMKDLDGESLSEEVNDALKSALEFIEDRKHYAYLEYKDDKSNKFWELSHYNGSYVVHYGKIGTEGTKKTKDFDSAEEAFKAGDKLIAQKLKKGYIKIR